MKRISLTITFCLASTPAALAQQFSIEADGVLLNGTTVITTRENPIITGRVTTAEPLVIERTATGNIVAGFARLQMTAAGSTFVGDDASIFLSITEPASATEPTSYSYSTPPLRLPSGHSPVDLRLFDNSPGVGELKATGSIRLASDVIVLPVHVHAFVETDARVDDSLTEREVTSWFDLPNVRTGAQSFLDPVDGVIKTALVTENVDSIRNLYLPADPIWDQARIQFRLESYDVIENDELARQIISDNDRTLAPGLNELHRRYQETPGIHIYLGQNTENIGSGGGIIAGQTDGPNWVTCGGPSDGDLIVLAWDEARGARDTLAHEIGHYLGLGHTTDLGMCAEQLIVNPEDAIDNLMGPFGFSETGRLSPQQIERARQIAMQRGTAWGAQVPEPSYMLWIVLASAWCAWRRWSMRRDRSSGA